MLRLDNRELAGLLRGAPAGVDEVALRRLAHSVQSRSSSQVVRVEGDRVLLRRQSDQMDLLCILLANQVEQDGTWWTDLDCLRTHLEQSSPLAA
ncbi:MAG: hypothetical protein HY332_01315 [Chloroflexi bacterium]|nr:hypothetical protein [Chloroflexota bacterium]